MGNKRSSLDRTARTLASMRRDGVTVTYSDTHTDDGRRRREPRPADRRTGTRAGIVAAAMREA